MIEVEQWLKCEESGQPFAHCIHCHLRLREIGSTWLVNKDYHRGECILEYAICQPCREFMSNKFSEETKAAIRNFLEGEIDWTIKEREFALMMDPAERLDACIACNEQREHCEGFSISGAFDTDGTVLLGPLPLLLCNVCVVKITNTTSEESRATWRQFISDHFEGPPNDEEGRNFGFF